MKKVTRTERRRKRQKALSIVVSAVLWLICLTYIYPFVWMIFNSFKTEAAYRMNPFSLPLPAVLDSYRLIFGGPDVFIAFSNSLFNTVITIVGVVLISFIVAYFLGRYRFKGRAFLYAFFLTGLLVPGLGLLIPSYIQFHTLKMLNHRYTLLVPYIAFGLPMAIYLYESYIRTIPAALEEAAFIDGAMVTDIMRLVIFPICRPMTSTIIVLNFLDHWNEFPFALVLNSNPKFHTVTVWLSTFQSALWYGNLTGKLTAMLIITVPVIVAYVLFREQMMHGLSTGAIKG